MKNSLENEFDQFIKGSLKDLQVPFDSNTWDQLEQRMDQETVREVDETARLALANLSVPYNAASWDQLEQRIDQEVVLEVDQAAREAVANLSVPYSPATWKVLSDRLDRLDYRRKLIALKVVEAAIILLAIITAVRFIHEGVPATQEEVPVMERQHMAMLDAENTSESLTNAHKATADHQPNPATTPTMVQPANETFSAKEIQEEKELAQAAETTAEAMSTASRIAIVPAIPFLDRREIQLQGDQRRLFALRDTDFKKVPRNKRPIATISGKDLAVQSDRHNLTGDLMSESLVGLPTLDVQMIMHEDMPISLAAVAPRIRKAKTLTTRIGLYRQISEHSIRQIQSSNRKHVQSVTIGGTGLATSIQSGMLGFDFGVAYEKLGFYGERSNMEVHKIQVPLNLRVVPVSNRYFDVYLKAGATAHGSIYAQYEQPLASRSSRSYNEKFNGGLLTDHGNTRNDMYYSLNYAIGTEIKFFENWSVFFEAMIQQHHRGELGHNKIEINSRSISIGVNRTL